ncbi:MAG: alpha-L-fucosidase [Verrucomicrobiota bacterium]
MKIEKIKVRYWIGVAVAVLGTLPLTPVPAAQPPAQPASSLARPTPQQVAWQDLEMGMFIHLAPQTWQNNDQDQMTIEASAMNPEKLDTDQWVRTAEGMGAKYIVFVAKHEGGFCWWQTETTDFGVRNSPWRGGKGDVLADLTASCRKRGMRLGVYISPIDRKLGVDVGGRATDPTRQAGYEKLFRQQLTEVLSRYGDMVEVWFDGSLIFDVGDLLARYAPNAVIFQSPQASIRWVGNEDGVDPYPAWNAVVFPKTGKKWGEYTAAEGDPNGSRWLPLECDARIRATWFWRTDNADTLKSVDQLMDMYYKSVGHGTVFLLNQTPDRTGLIPEADARRGAEFGAEIKRRLGTPRTESLATGAEVTLDVTGDAPIDHIVIMENIANGERVRSYVVEGMVNGTWQQLTAGSAVGHKKIDRIAPVAATRVRLRIPEAVGTPEIKRFAVYGAM